MEISGDDRGEVEDRRGLSDGVKVGGGILGLIVTALAVYMGVSPQQAQQIGEVAGRAAGGKQTDTRKRDLSPDELKEKEFYEKVLGNINRVWADSFKANRYPAYEAPHMTLFEGQVQTGCGGATSDVGPFYCPADRKLYLDTAFYKTLKQLGGSTDDFSKAYVIAHETGHHVQNLLGYSQRVDEARRKSKAEANDASVRLELQADYLAGCWAHNGSVSGGKLTLTDADIAGALKTAHSIGDDKLQGRTARPESYTHGTSDQRKRAFTNGYKTGDASKEALEKFFSARSSQDL